MESLELFGREVLPEFQEREEQRAPRKAAYLEPVVEAALARRAPEPPSLPADYSFPAIPKAWADRTGDERVAAWLDRVAADRAAGVRDSTAGIIGGLG